MIHGPYNVKMKLCLYLIYIVLFTNIFKHNGDGLPKIIKRLLQYILQDLTEYMETLVQGHWYVLNSLTPSLKTSSKLHFRIQHRFTQIIKHVSYFILIYIKLHCQKSLFPYFLHKHWTWIFSCGQYASIHSCLNTGPLFGRATQCPRHRHESVLVDHE